MLKQRVITALVLLAILLPALFYDAPQPFMLVMLVFMAAGSWEWGRLNGLGQPGAVMVAAVCLLACGLAWRLGWLQRSLADLWILAGCFWVAGGALLLRTGVAGWPGIPRFVRLVAGVFALWLAWLAVVQAHMVGVNFLLSVLALVWAADIGAYFSGRAWGLRFTRKRLAASISPGKSWEGVWGGMAAVALLAVAWVVGDLISQAAIPSLFTRLALQHPWLSVPLVGILTAMSVVGDLVESLVKRSAGFKDSSGLLPGHGGVLDRVDALLPTLPLAMLLLTFSS